MAPDWKAPLAFIGSSFSTVRPDNVGADGRPVRDAACCRPTKESSMRILFMCTANSCRSILSEAAFNHLAPPGFEAVSAGSFPKGQVLPRSMLSRRSHPAPVNTSRASCCSTARPESVRSAACWWKKPRAFCNTLAQSGCWVVGCAWSPSPINRRCPRPTWNSTRLTG